VLSVRDSTDGLVTDVCEGEEPELAKDIAPAAGQPLPNLCDGEAHEGPL